MKVKILVPDDIALIGSKLGKGKHFFMSRLEVKTPRTFLVMKLPQNK